MSRALTTRVLALALEHLGIRVVGEGVEDPETWEALTRLGCELVQGYFLSRPMPAVEVARRPSGSRGEPVAAGRRWASTW
jgi:diguanylate cyclase